MSQGHMREAGVQRHSCCEGIMTWRPVLLSQRTPHWSLTDRGGSVHLGMYWLTVQIGSEKPSFGSLSSELVGGKTLSKQDHRRNDISLSGGINQLNESRQS